MPLEGRRRRHNVEAGVTSCVVWSVQKCGFVWCATKTKEQKNHLSFIHTTAMQCNCSSSLTSFLFHPVFHIDTRAFRSLLRVVYTRHLQYEHAIVVCYIMDDSWRKCRLLDHGYNAVAMTLGPATMLCPGFCTGPWQKMTEMSKKSGILWVHTYPTTSFRRRGRCVQSSVEIGSEMWTCVQTNKETNKKEQKTISSLYIRLLFWKFKFRKTL